MLITRHELDAAAAALLLDAAEAHAASIGVPQNIAVVDAGGRLLAFLRMDGAKFHSIETSLAKAVTAASIAAPSGGAPSDAGVLVGIATRGAFTNLRGGLPVLVGDHVAGAIGVGSGAPDEDIAVAEAAIAALRSKIDGASD